MDKISCRASEIVIHVCMHVVKWLPCSGREDVSRVRRHGLLRTGQCQSQLDRNTVVTAA